MRKAVFWLVYFLTPAVPLWLYISAAGFAPDTYTASVVLGVSAYVLLFNQFILASRPGFIIRALGAKTALALHRTAPAAVIVLAAAHFPLKLANGFSASSLKAGLGFGAFLLLTLLAAFAAVIMANTVLSRTALLGAFKKWFNSRTGMTYKQARSIHNVFVVVMALVLIHALLASSSDFLVNPAGAAWMIFWFLVSFGFYIRYRLAKRGGADAKKAAS